MRFLQVIGGIALSCAFLSPSVAIAQQSPSPSQVQAAVKTAIKAAELSPHQLMQIKPMVQQYQQQTANADDAQKKTAKEQLLKGIVGIMTPDQQAKFKASLKSSLGSSGSQ
jgi:hypothetical protein